MHDRVTGEFTAEAISHRELGGRTELPGTISFENDEERDRLLQLGMAEGSRISMDCFTALLALQPVESQSRG